MLYNFAKHEPNVARLSRLMKYCVSDERGKCCAKILLHYTDIVTC